MFENKNARFIDSGWTFFVATLFLGPLALPLLWRNSKWSRKTKVILTLGVIVLTVFLVYFGTAISTKIFETLMMQLMDDAAVN